MDRNFKVRVSVGVGMFAVALLSLYTFNAVPFKIIYVLFSIVSAVELISFFRQGFSKQRLALAIVEIVLLVCGAVFIAKIDVRHFWYIILGVPGYDIFAYLSGKVFGGKVFKKIKTFPENF